MNQVVIKSHYTASELAAMQLPGIPSSKGKVLAKSEREGWAFIESTGIGGKRREFAPPADVMASIKARMLEQVLTQSPSLPVATVAPIAQLPSAVRETHGVATVSAQSSALKDWQKRVAEARAALLQEVERIAQVVGREKAILKVVIMAQDGTLPEHLARLVPVANARSGQEGKRTLSRRTVYDWFATFKANRTTGTVQAVNALAPKDQHAVAQIPAWAADLLAEYQRPQKPSLAWAVEQIASRHGINEQQLYHRARRFMQRMGNVESMTGRMGQRDIKNIKPFIRRDSSVLWPAEVYSADGHTFDAEVAHPAHGKPFRPEITTVRDTATRRLVGWSIDLAESGLAVLDALRHACETGGICSVFYVDNGSGYKNAMMSQSGTGMEARLGFTMTHSIAYNSQARGIVEKGHRDIWVRAAKELPTYMGKDMDAEAKNKVFKLTRKAIKAGNTSKYLMPWLRFLDFVKAHADRYNNRPHRSLKMIYDAELGRKRHMTPNEAWADGVNAGAQLATITPEESRELFRPMKEAKVLRGEVRLFNNQYFSHALTEYHGEFVRVAYDIHNAEQVWIYDAQGRFICVAEFEANKRAYFPEAFLEQAARKRSEGRLSRLDVKRQEVLDELEGPPKREIYDAHIALENSVNSTAGNRAIAHTEGMRVIASPVTANTVPGNLQAIMDRRQSERDTPVEVEPTNVSVIPESPQLRFRKWLELDELLTLGGTIDDAKLTKWYGTYPQTAEHASMIKRHQESLAASNVPGTAGTVIGEFKTTK